MSLACVRLLRLITRHGFSTSCFLAIAQSLSIPPTALITRRRFEVDSERLLRRFFGLTLGCERSVFAAFLRHFLGESLLLRGTALCVEWKAFLANETLHEDRECFG